MIFIKAKNNNTTRDSIIIRKEVTVNETDFM